MFKEINTLSNHLHRRLPQSLRDSPLPEGATLYTFLREEKAKAMDLADADFGRFTTSNAGSLSQPSLTAPSRRELCYEAPSTARR